MIDMMIAAFVLGHVENVSPMTIILKGYTFRVSQIVVFEKKRTRSIIRFEVLRNGMILDIRYIALADARRLSNLINQTIERSNKNAVEI